MTDDRKLCPNCGHSNRAEAKNCTQCGFAFFSTSAPAASASVEVLRKRCAQCGALNRMGAKVCSQCGAAFTGKRLITLEQKWCPQCGAERRRDAKACSFCGYRFKADSAPIEPPIEPPIVQSDDLSAPITPRTDLPHVPAPLPADLPEIRKGVPMPDLTKGAPATQAPIVQSNDLAEPVSARSVTGTTPTPKPRDLSGEPAPYLSKDELERLRQMSDKDTGLFLRRSHRDNKR